MKHLLILTLLVLTACAPTLVPSDPVACTRDAKICPDGSAVGRVGPDCEFQACPESSLEEQATQGKKCADADIKTYVGNSLDECATIRFMCEEGKEYFSDACGCGCIPSEQPTDDTSSELTTQDPEHTFCTLEQKENIACTREYMPVCGWNDPEKIQCIKYPCAQTYGNKCTACAAENVISWTLGECPQ